MGLKSRLVLVNLVEPDPIGVPGVLNDIKPQTPRLVVHRTLSVSQHSWHEPVFEARLDIDGNQHS